MKDSHNQGRLWMTTIRLPLIFVATAVSLLLMFAGGWILADAGANDKSVAASFVSILDALFDLRSAGGLRLAAAVAVVTGLVLFMLSILLAALLSGTEMIGDDGCETREVLNPGEKQADGATAANERRYAQALTLIRSVNANLDQVLAEVRQKVAGSDAVVEDNPAGQQSVRLTSLNTRDEQKGRTLH